MSQICKGVEEETHISGLVYNDMCVFNNGYRCVYLSPSLLSRICQRFSSHVQVPEWEAHDWVFRRLSFAVMRGVSEQLIGRQLADFSW